MIKKLKKGCIARIFTVIIVLMFFNANGLAVIKGNFSHEAFGFGLNTTSYEGSAINEYVVVGAGYFLKSHSEILLFLNKVEIADMYGLDYDETGQIVDSAIAHMEDANATYIVLNQLADTTPYNSTIIDALAHFNYVKFGKDNSLNFTIFRDVARYLRRGDVRGIYHKMQEDTEKLLGILYDIKNSIDASEFPATASLWDLNHTCFLSLVFDQYVAEVFYEIIQNQ